LRKTSSLRKFRPALLAGVLLMAAAPQANAQFWFFDDKPEPQQQRKVKPLPRQAENPVRQRLARPDEDGVLDLSRTSLLDPQGRGGAGRGGAGQGAAGQGGAGVGYASIPADADPNYSTPVDLDSSVNFKQATQHMVPDPTGQAAGTLTINTKLRRLYYSLGDGQAVEYSIAVGKAGFAWKGVASVGRKSYWPGWTPPPEMIERRPELPEHMDGSLSNPLGARALYLFQGSTDTLFRIHGTNEPSSIGHAASSGCIRMHNADVIDLYGRVIKGARVVVM
jgi:lipoprotein-anchoring transpeptidase ErfK/SrfK